MTNKVTSLLVSVLGDYQEFSNNEYYFVCPLCTKRDGKKKLAIKINPDNVGEVHWHCWRDASHRGKSLRQLFRKMNANTAIEQYDEIVGKKHLSYDLNNLNSVITPFKPKEIENNIVFLPKEYERLADSEPSYFFNMATSYLQSRGLDYYDIVKYNIGYCSSGQYAGYVIIPSYNSEGMLNYFVGRTFQNAYLKYKNPKVEKSKIIFNEIHINWRLPIIICEGVFDAMAIKRNAIPILGNTISNHLKQKIMNYSCDVYIALDSDMFQQSVRVIEDFVRNGLNVYYVELDKKDPSETGFFEMNNKIYNSEKITMQHLLKLKMKPKTNNSQYTRKVNEKTKY